MFRLSYVAVFLLVLLPVFTRAQDLDALADEAVERVQAYLQLDTINPPGNESNGARFFADIFEAEGIPYETVESAPGRGNIWARLEGGDEPALLLLHHMDVVPADEAFWDVPPYSGAVQGGYIYGRGALDTKTLGILHLQAFLELHRTGAWLDRDVIFMATADEEAGGFFGAGWLVENRPELFDDVGWVLNEGGGGEQIGDRVAFFVEVTQKVPIWLRLTATDTPGHGSTPRVTSSVGRLIGALDNLRRHRFEPRMVPAVDAYFRAISESAEEPWRSRYADMAATIGDDGALLALQLESPFHHALTRNTCSITRLEGSGKINVVPPTATAEIDCRMLSDQDPAAFVEELSETINDPSVTIETIMVFSPAVSTTDTELYRAIGRVVGRHHPDATVMPGVLTGFTDSHFLRDLGIVAYGFDPMLIPAEDGGGVHGNNERISVENVRRGTRMMLEIVLEAAGG